MTPASLRRRPLSLLPAPELVSLIDDPDGLYADSPEGWWTQYGGAVDARSGVVYIPREADHPPCRFPCDLCAERRQH
ncbi:hypothetical protein GCM10010319_61020 [Streptomyces blastmyceticus]|uniref:Uncharacterized protein n=1 Tax=Streptomyces blastmyceticus TaxID=68180 RepID=A0ABN0XVX0_9ACTN